MKNLYLILIFSVSLFFTSCDQSKNMEDVTFPTTITKDILVNLNGTSAVYDDSELLNLNNTDTGKYLDKLKKVIIKKMTCQIVDFTGDPNGKISGDIKAEDKLLRSFTDQTVKDAADAGTVFDVTDTTTSNILGNNLLNNKLLTIQNTGTAVYSGSMSFKVRFTLELSVTAGS